MTTEPHEGRLDDGLTVLRRVRRVRDYEVLAEEDGTRRPSSQAFVQGNPDGDVSVYLASETTPERITQDHPGTYVAEVEISTIRGQGLDVEREPVEGDLGTATSQDARPSPEQERWLEARAGQQDTGRRRPGRKADSANSYTRDPGNWSASTGARTALPTPAPTAMRWTPSVGQDQATIKWDSCVPPYDTKASWSEHLLLFRSSSSSTGWPRKTFAGVR